jgi:hypothetical protein
MHTASQDEEEDVSEEIEEEEQESLEDEASAVETTKEVPDA